MSFPNINQYCENVSDIYQHIGDHLMHSLRIFWLLDLTLVVLSVKIQGPIMTVEEQFS